MKKIAFAALLAVSSPLAFAGVSGLASYEFGDATKSQATAHTVTLGVSKSVRGFNLEALATGDAVGNTGRRNTEAAGYEFAVSKSFDTVYGIKPTLRVGLGHKAGYIDASYTSVTANLAYFVAPRTSLVVEHRLQESTRDAGSFRNNRTAAGVEYVISNKLTATVLATHTEQERTRLAGLQTSVKYSF